MHCLILIGELEKGDSVLIHAGGSGVGTAAVQLCIQAGCKPIVTAGSESKLQMAKDLGAVAGYNYKEGDWSEKVLEFTQGDCFQQLTINLVILDAVK
jgi:tumor protein p53-inducible protein 3